MARSDEEPRVVVVDDDEREVTLELVEGEPDRLDEVALVVALDEVGDRLGVGLGAEGVPLRDEALRELAVVLDDAVEHDRELRRVAAGERVRVRLGHAAVRRPARVAEAGRRRRVDCSPRAPSGCRAAPTARTYSSPSASRSAIPAES